MVVRRRFRAGLILAGAYLAGTGMVAYFLHNAEIGRRGLMAKQVLKIQIFDANRELDGLKVEHREWDRRLTLLRADQVDRDLLEERGRILLGRVHRNDVVIVAP